MDIVAVGVFKSHFRSAKGKHYIVLETDAGEFNLESSEVDLSQLPQGFRNVVQVTGKLAGRVFSGERGPVQKLIVKEISVKRPS